MTDQRISPDKSLLEKPDVLFAKILNIIHVEGDTVSQTIAKLDALDVMVRMMSAEIKAAYAKGDAKNKLKLEKMGIKS